MKEEHCPKECHNSNDHHHCEHCGTKCTDDECNKSNCEIITDLTGKKNLTCMCPGSSCICLGRAPSQKDLDDHLVKVYGR
jgi:hypothetical protein